MWWSTGSGRIELNITKAQARIGHHQGDCGNDIAWLVTHPSINRQLHGLNADLLRSELREYGAWDDAELTDYHQNIRRLVWIACGDICEQMAQRGAK